MTKRIIWVDAIRAGAMIAIVLGHALGQFEGGFLYRWLYYFHVPLCIVISGYLFKENNTLEGAFQYIKKVFRNLYVPYIFWAIISIAIYLLIIDRANMYNGFINYFKGLIFANGSLGRDLNSSGYMVWNTPLWYLPCLISIEVITSLLCCIIRSSYKHEILFVTFIALGAFCYFVHLHTLFMELESAIYLMPFYFQGLLIRKHEENIVNRFGAKKKGALVAVMAGLCVVGSVLGYVNGVPGYLSDGYGKSYLLFLLSGEMLCCGFVGIARTLSVNGKVIGYIGKNTLKILVMHRFFIMFFSLLIKRFLQNASLNSQIQITISSIITVFTVALCLIAGSAIEKFCPILIGKRKMEVK